MLNPYPRYEGKPTAYLDQNILSYFVRNGMNEFSICLKDNFQVLYSEETLKEIERAGIENSKKYLAVLSFFKPARLKESINKDFSVTGEAIIKFIDPFTAFEEYINRDRTYDCLIHAMNILALKLYGGLPELTIDDIIEEQIKSFNNSMESLKIEAREALIELPELLRRSEECFISAQDEVQSALMKVAEKFKKAVKDSRNWSGIAAFRDHFRNGPLEMQNIKGPNVLEKIWNRYREFDIYKNTGKTIDDFYGVSKNPINPERPYYNHQKVGSIYTMLNFVGYYSDRRIHKENRYRADRSDYIHASLGTFANHIFSNDKRFAYKVLAIYEYLDIPTKVNHPECFA